MNKLTNRILSIVAFFMVITVIGTLAWNYIPEIMQNDSSINSFSFSEVSYENVGSYSEQLAPVKIYDRWGYCDNQGKILIVPQFIEAGGFSSGLAAVKESNGGLYGYIDNSGTFMIEPQFSYAGTFSENLAVCGSISDKMLGYIDKTGKFIIPEKYFEAGNFSEGLAKVRTTSEGLYSYIDQNGNVVIPANYSEASDFSEGLAAVSANGLWGYIDQTGQMIIQPHFAQAHTFHEELAAVKLNDTWGYIDKSGNFVIKNIYSEADDFSAGFAPVKFSDSGLWGYITNNGEKVITGDYLQATSFSDGVAAVQVDSKWIFVTDDDYNLEASEQSDTMVFSDNSEELETTDYINGNNKVDDTGKTDSMNVDGTESISNDNVTNLVKQIQLHVNESTQLSGLIKAHKVIGKLVLKVTDEDGTDKGIYISIKPESNTYNLEEVSVDGRIEPFNIAGKYKLQLIAKLEGEIHETKIGEINVEVLESQKAENQKAEIEMIDSSAYPIVNIFTSVFDDENKPVGNLTLDNFKLYESVDGQEESEQKLEQVLHLNGNEGLNVALVFDSSLSMYNDDKTEANSNMEFAKKSAVNFINSGGFGANDRVSIQSFGKTFTVDQKFTGSVKKLVKAINDIEPHPDTAIYDAINCSLDTLSIQQGKKCIIIFTDGEDTVSALNYMDVVESAIIKGVPVYSIAIGQEAKTNELKSISDKTGGAFYYLKNTKELSDIYKDITNKLRYQYQLTYRSASGVTANKITKIRIFVTNGNNSQEVEKTYVIK